MTMKLLVSVFAIAAFAGTMAFGQSSGNFSAAGFSGTCTIAGSSGFGGTGACLDSTNTTDCKILHTPIKVSNGNDVTLLITPSAVTGLFTNTKISTSVPSASAEIGIKVCVEVVDSNGNEVAGAVKGGDANGCAMYDERFQQVSTQLFSTLSECALTGTVTATACTTATAGAVCPAGDFCQITNSSANPPTGVCAAPNPLCNFDLILSTLSAHSYNFIADVPGGNYSVEAEWSVVDASASAGGSSVAACLGPGNVSVTQTKVFNNSGSLSF